MKNTLLKSISMAAIISFAALNVNASVEAEFDETAPLIEKARIFHGGLGISSLETTLSNIQEEAQPGSIMNMTALLQKVKTMIVDLSEEIDPAELNEKAPALGRTFITMRDTDLPETMLTPSGAYRVKNPLSTKYYKATHNTLSFLLDDFQSMKGQF